MIDRNLGPEAIVSALEEETPDRRPLMWRLEREAPAPALVGALERARRPLTRQLLCDLLGFRLVRSAVPALADALDDPVVGVRASAADALGKIVGYGSRPAPAGLVDAASAAMRDRWAVEESAAVRGVLAFSLALTGDPSVRPVLESALDDPEEQVRSAAESGLARLTVEASS
ncbi:HEAT repeat domain-containing protein [Actinomadura sp. HBU206391]|uniref:HEAT repeat domain-containing protein n=1 Tax=Actinomadura sp. HBU206391 TaxID=2731692 RepID=UPI00164FEA2E|nr:HEAT repeat domain-containing protein [Actinomadura sp. HBU206391]MBC6456950.1 HEAT repeat domain-containing protein [Actinomadura sp. HBU206391]